MVTPAVDRRSVIDRHTESTVLIGADIRQGDHAFTQDLQPASSESHQ